MTPPTVADRLRAARARLTGAEVQVASALLEQYPIAGLQPVTRLAADAGVSTPTVLRLLTKLGFEGYGDFREALFAEVAAMLHSPVIRVPHGPATAVDALLAEGATSLTRAVTETVSGIDRDAFTRAVDLLADLDRPVLVGGGRMSSSVARHLTFFLQMMRPGVTELGPESGAVLRAVMDITAANALVLFDFRRYQASTIAAARRAAAVGAAIVVVTDAVRSPIAEVAEVVLVTAGPSPTPYDGMVGAMALVELLVAATIEQLGPEAQARVARFDALEQIEDAT